MWSDCYFDQIHTKQYAKAYCFVLFFYYLLQKKHFKPRKSAKKRRSREEILTLILTKGYFFGILINNDVYKNVMAF